MSPLHWGVAALALAGGMVGGAQFMEHILGLDPCPLCLMQRLWTMFGGAVVLAGVALNPRSPVYPGVALACTVVGAAFSARQIWLQHLPADQIPACGPDMAYMIDAFPLAEILKAMTMGTGNCAEVTWTLLGMSIAGWALIGFALLGVSLVQWLRSSRQVADF